MKIGYAGAAVASEDVDHTVQLFELKTAGCKHFYQERFTEGASNRPRLHAMLENLRPGDTVVVTRLERLAHSSSDLLDITRRIRAKGAGLVALELKAGDLSAAGHDLVPRVLEAISALDRRASLRLAIEGLTPLKKANSAASFHLADSAEVRRLRSQGKSPAAIARRLKIGRASVYGAVISRPAI